MFHYQTTYKLIALNDYSNLTMSEMKMFVNTLAKN